MKSILGVFASPRMAAILLLGFASGLPLGLTGGTLQAWMANEKVDLAIIGVFSLVGLPYTLKFIWAPLMDRYVPPFLGRRRGWMLIGQIGLVVAISAMAFSDPKNAPGALAMTALVVAFFSATQDIAIDAYRTEVLPAAELGAGTGIYIMGYRIAMLVSGAIALILADHLPWRVVYLIMAATMSVGIVTSFLSPEPEARKLPRTLREVVVEPLVEFFQRPGSIEVLLFIVFYKLDVAVALALSTKFFIDLGFTKTEIGAVTKVFGLAATIAGTLIGGGLITQWGLKKCLWIFGVLQGVSNLLFAALAHIGNSRAMLVTTIAAENFASGMGTAAYTAFIMMLCNKKFTATQYALLTSLMATTRVLAGAPTGILAKFVGWETYFVIATLLAIPGLALLLRYDHWQTVQEDSLV